MDQVDHSEVGTARRWIRNAWLRLRVPHDPGRAGLRRAARAALVMPAAFAFAQFVIGNGQLTTFVAFGCFALLVMADFGGFRGPRALAYAAAAGIGAVLIALGTLASASPWIGAFVMLLVGLAVSFAGVFGGYASAVQTALLLAFVLAVSISAPPVALAPRLGGWLIAGAVSLLAGVFLWPRFEQVALHRQAASACRALAALIEAQRSRAASPDLPQVREAAATAEAAVSAVRQAYAATPMRPAGPARRDRAFVELLSKLERIVEFAAQPPSQQPLLSAHHPCLLEGDRLASTVVQTLAASAGVLSNGGPPPDLRALQASWLTHREALDQWAAQALRAGTAPEDVLDGLGADDTLRVVAYLTLALGSNAAIAAGVRMDTGMETGTTTAEMPLRTRRRWLPPACGADDPHRACADLQRAAQQPARRAGARAGGADCRALPVESRVLGRPGHAVGAALQCAGDRPHDAADARGHARWLRHRGAFPRGGGHRHHRAVGDLAGRSLPRCLRRQRHRLRSGTSRIHDRRPYPLQPDHAGRLAAGDCARGGCGGGRWHQRGRGCAAVAARRAGRAAGDAR